MLDRTERERAEVERELAALDAALRELENPDTDAMLDVFNGLRDSIRGAAKDSSEGLGALNDRLRAIFEAFCLEVVEEGVVGILPVLRADVVERYRSDRLTIVSGDVEVESAEPASPESPVALFATGEEAIRPPAKSLEVELSKTGSYSHE